MNAILVPLDDYTSLLFILALYLKACDRACDTLLDLYPFVPPEYRAPVRVCLEEFAFLDAMLYVKGVA